MKTYLLTIKQKSGLLTELQSDTIYGHFCWRLKETLGEQKLKDFLNFYKIGNPIFLLSDGFLKVGNEIRFPRPFIFEPPEIKKDKYEKVLDFVDNKFLKERNYLKLDELNEFLNTGRVKIIAEKESTKQGLEHLTKKKKKKRRIFEESLRVSVQIDRRTLGTMQGRLFSYKPIFYSPDVLSVILLKVNDDKNFNDFKCEQILKDTFTIGFGKKKSSGYGRFEVVDFSPFEDINEPTNANSFMVLGNYLPSKEDYVEPIGYEINTKYGKFGEQLSLSENPFKNPLIFLTAGSCFKSNNSKEFFGRITDENEISKVNNFAVQFGMPFTLNFNLVP